MKDEGKRSWDINQRSWSEGKTEGMTEVTGVRDGRSQLVQDQAEVTVTAG